MITILLFFWFTNIWHIGVQHGNNFVYELSTTKTEFFEGETIPLFIKVKNNSNQMDSIYSFGYNKLNHNLYLISEDGDSTAGFMLSLDDGNKYTVFQPYQTIDYYNNDLTMFKPLAGSLFYMYIPAGKYIVRGYIPEIRRSISNVNDIIKSNDLELTIKENIGDAKEEFKAIKKLCELQRIRSITLESFNDSVFNSFLSKYPESKFVTKVVQGFRLFFNMDKYTLNDFVDLHLNAIRNANITDSTYAILLYRELHNFLDKNETKFSYTQSDFENFLRYNPEIDPIIREQLIFDLERRR